MDINKCYEILTSRQNHIENDQNCPCCNDPARFLLAKEGEESATKQFEMELTNESNFYVSNDVGNHLNQFTRMQLLDQILLIQRKRVLVRTTITATNELSLLFSFASTILVLQDV
jgi:hypothetical protein